MQSQNRHCHQHNQNQGSVCNFDLEYILNIGEEFRLSKNGRFRNIYDDEFQQVPITKTSSNDELQDDFKVEQDFDTQTILQYVSSIVIPPQPPKPEQSPPQISLEPVFINGYVSLENTQSVHYVHSGTIVFAAATLGVVMDTTTRQQQYFGVTHQTDNSNSHFEKYHRSAIVYICFDLASGLVATGSMGASPQICIWTAVDQQPIAKFYQGKGTKAVSIIKFLNDKHIITVDRQSRAANNLNVWSIQGKRITTTKCPGSVYGVSVEQLSGKIAVASSKGAFLSEYKEGQQLQLTSCDNEYTTSVAHSVTEPIFGRSDGSVLYKQQRYPIHKGCIFSITSKGGLIYTSGGEDRTLKVFDASLQELRSIQLQEYARSIDVFEDNILVSLRNGKILEITPDSTQCIMNCHFSGETWGLCYDSALKCFVTCGDDDKILKFSPKDRKVIEQEPISFEVKQNKKYEKNKLNSFPSSKQSRAIDISSELEAYVTNYGRLYLKRKDKSPAWEAHKLSDVSHCVKFSPDGTLLAVGCHDDCLYLFDVDPKKPDKQVIQQRAVLFGHESEVSSFDFNTDSTLLRSIGEAGELRYWDIKTHQQIVMASAKCTKQLKDIIKNAEWTSMGKFCYETNQLWQQIHDIDFINVVRLSNSKRYIAVGQDDNCVRVYRNPCVKGRFRRFKVHGGNVLNLCWSDDDKYLASVGGIDRCMVVWEVETL